MVIEGDCYYKVFCELSPHACVGLLRMSSKQISVSLTEDEGVVSHECHDGCV